MARQIVAGIDIGTSEVKVIIAEASTGSFPKIIGTGSSESRGVYRGYIANQPEASRSVAIAVRRAEKAAGVKIKRAYVAFGGIGLESTTSTGNILITRADQEIGERDLTLALEAAETNIPKAEVINKKIINTVPIEYKIDGKAVWGQAVGLKGHKLEVKALFITCLEHHLNDLISTVEEAGVEVIDVVASPVASSLVTVSKKEKRVGCILIDIGAETLSSVVFENNNLISLQVLPSGASDLSNEIALSLKISLEEAESLKIGDDRGLVYPKKKLDDVILKHFSESFGQVEKHLKSIGRDGLLPAGVILAGGGASISLVKSVAERVLKLPAHLAEIHSDASEGKIRDRSWAVASGLVLLGFNSDEEQRSIGIRNGSLPTGTQWGRMIYRWFSQFLP